jgi:hypothetical protein
MAYADFLVEHGDPRGELIQVQLALEDESHPARERQRLRQRERELLDAHEREWLGELAPLLLGTPEEQRALFAAELARPDVQMDEEQWPDRALRFRHGWARGWLDSLECSCLTVEMARKLGRAPIARLLRALVYRDQFFGYAGSAGLFTYQEGPDLPPSKYAHGHRYFRPIEVLAHYPAVRNLRFFQYGQEVDPEEDSYDAGTQFDQLGPLVASMPRLEELSIFGHIYGREAGLPDLSQLFGSPTLTRLRVLRHYHGHAYPLEVLAGNPALGRLEQLLCFPHNGAGYDPDSNTFRGAIDRDDARAVVTSPHLRSLTHLQLRGCGGGDETVEDVIASGILRRLKVLDLRHGRVTDRGAGLLAGCPDARGLEVLDLINNRLTGAGIAAMQAAGLRVRADRQLRANAPEDAFVWFGDSE